MNLLDLGIIVLLGLITLRGYYRGLFQELAVLVGVVGGVVVAAHTYLRLAALAQRWITDPLHARWIAFAVVLVAVYWVTRLVAHFLQRLLYHLYLDFFDRLLGGAFALAKGALLLGFGLMFLGVLLPRDSRLLKESRTAPLVQSLARLWSSAPGLQTASASTSSGQRGPKDRPRNSGRKNREAPLPGYLPLGNGPALGCRESRPRLRPEPRLIAGVHSHDR
jgi:membrane protein required for colicin V production